MSTVTSIAASGLQAAERRLEIAARNIANSGLPVSAPADVVNAFVALRADQTEAPDGGTVVTVSVAPEQGTDLASEAVNLTIASY